MKKKKTLEQSIEKTICILGKLDVSEDLAEVEKYQEILNNYISEYKVIIKEDKRYG